MAKKLNYEHGAPKFDVYTTEVWDKEWTRQQQRRCFANFDNAYLWGQQQIARLNSTIFCIIGEKFERIIYSTIEEYESWSNKPFNRMDCNEVTWRFDQLAKLQDRSYEYGTRFKYMPSDVEEDAGTHFKKGDMVKYGKTVCVVSGVPGKKKDNRWENYYMVFGIIKKDDGRIYANHSHFHESSLVKFTGTIDKSDPLLFLQKNIDDIVDGEVKL